MWFNAFNTCDSSKFNVEVENTSGLDCAAFALRSLVLCSSVALAAAVFQYDDVSEESKCTTPAAQPPLSPVKRYSV